MYKDKCCVYVTFILGVCVCVMASNTNTQHLGVCVAPQCENQYIKHVGHYTRAREVRVEGR